MSEAEKATEVEDVLSSIRRLVANRPRSIPKTPAQAVDPDEQAAAPQSNPEPASFIETMNASIAEIAQETEVALPNSETVEEDPPLDLDDAQTRAAHVDAFLANATDQSVAPEVVHADRPEKPEPFVLRADMSAGTKEPEPTTAKVEEPEPVLKEENKAQVEYETSFQDIPEDEKAFPDPEGSEIEDKAADEQFIDEDMLREIVGELVRSELQGDLGDRITRNVRKLVRREIHQALAARNFD